MSCGLREKPARYSEVQSEKVRPLRLVVNQRVLAERNQAVAPVGAWVESAQNQWQEAGQSIAVVSAYYVEEELKKQQREKQEKLQRFQHEVKRRVNQHARMRKKQQLLKSYNANPVSRRSPLCLPEDTEEGLLDGHHDLPAELHSKTLISCPAGKENGVHLEETGKVCNRFLKVPYPSGQAPAVSTDFRAALVLRPGVDLEENKKRRENQYLTYRRRYMDIEREQVKEIRRQKEHGNKIAAIKKQKELCRNMEEQRIRLSKLQKSCLEEGEQRMLAHLKLEEQKLKVTEKNKQKIKEHVGYIDALRAQMKEKIELHKVELPPLCFCGTNFWDAHPDTCVNNCVFYRNPKAYAKALQSVIASCNISSGTAATKLSAQAIASARACSFKSV